MGARDNDIIIFFHKYYTKKKIRLRDSYLATNILRVSGRDFIREWILV